MTVEEAKSRYLACQADWNKILRYKAEYKNDQGQGVNATSILEFLVDTNNAVFTGADNIHSVVEFWHWMNNVSNDYADWCISHPDQDILGNPAGLSLKKGTDVFVVKSTAIEKLRDHFKGFMTEVFAGYYFNHNGSMLISGITHPSNLSDVNISHFALRLSGEVDWGCDGSCIVNKNDGTQYACAVQIKGWNPDRTVLDDDVLSKLYADACSNDFITQHPEVGKKDMLFITCGIKPRFGYWAQQHERMVDRSVIIGADHFKQFPETWEYVWTKLKGLAKILGD